MHLMNKGWYLLDLSRGDNPEVNSFLGKNPEANSFQEFFCLDGYQYIYMNEVNLV